MEAYSTLKEVNIDIKKDRVTINYDLPGSIQIKIMKPEGYTEEYTEYRVWIEIDTHMRIIKQWHFKTIKEAEDKWKEVHEAIENGNYELLLRVDGGEIKIESPSFNTKEVKDE